MKRLLIVCLFFARLCSLQVQSRVIYVTPGDKSLCPKGTSSCQTLNWYNQNSNGSFMANDTEVRFLSGAHVLNTSVAVINNCYNLTIVGFENKIVSNNIPKKMYSTVLIDCNPLINTSTFKFMDSKDVLIKNICFESCGANIDGHKPNVSLFFCSGSNIILQGIVVNSTKGYGLHIEDVLGSVQISESGFLRSGETKLKQAQGGNARVLFKGRKQITNLTISSSYFLGRKGSSFGLIITIDGPHVHVEMNNVTIRNNCGNLILKVKDHTSSSIIKVWNSHIDYGTAIMGGGMRFLFEIESSNFSICTANDVYKVLEVHNTTFHSNSAEEEGGAVYLKVYQSDHDGYDCIFKSVEFSNCSFRDNFGKGAVVEIGKHLTQAEHTSPPLNVRFEACQFHNNSVIGQKYGGHILNIIMSQISISDCAFIGSKGTALSLLRSNLNMYKNITFKDNHAEWGGAMKVCDGSFVFLHKNSHIQFINNSAQLGGTMFIHETCSLPCVIQPSISLPHVIVPINELHRYLKVDFLNNSATIAGDTLYGGSLDTCYTTAEFSYGKNKSFSSRFIDIIDEIFNMDNQMGPSRIASDPKGVCFCSNSEDSVQHSSIACQKHHPVIEAYPGERFSLSVVTVGQLNGWTLGSIHSSLQEERAFHQLVVHDGGKYSNHCISVNYTLHTNETNATIILQPLEKNSENSHNVNVTIHVLPCPLGFELAADSSGLYTCRCSSTLKFSWYTKSIQCDINTELIHIPKESIRVWIGCRVSNSSLLNVNVLTKSQLNCDVLQVSRGCDYYCTLTARNVSIFKLDEQCIQGRTGVLCGACRHGLSRTLGIDFYCKKCTNASLAEYMFITFLSGVFIVFILTILNITVTEGTINGLILYATVIFRSHRNPQTSTNHVLNVMWTFIAWLNLESGSRHACAYNGLTGYQYVWLNFAYAFYLLLIQVAIILLSRRFIFFTKLFGRNIVKVLATLLFLTYSQIIYAIFHTFHFARIYESTPRGQHDVRRVWHYDGNVPYLGLKHSFLFITALICLIITSFFVLCLLFIQCLQRRTDYCCLRWVERLRPFFEAYTGPCNNNYRFWPGLLYLIRTIMYAVSMYFDDAHVQVEHDNFKMNSLSILCGLMMLLACLSTRGVYKKWPLNILEFSFILNLSILCISLSTHHNHTFSYMMSIGVAMITTSGIFVYHIYRVLRENSVCAKVKKFLSVLVSIPKRKYFKKNSEYSPLLPQAFPTYSQIDDSQLDD